MKRVFILFLFLAVLLVPCFSSYQMFGDSLSFTWLAEDALYPESIVNPFSSTSSLNILMVTQGQPRTIKYANAVSDEYDDVEIYGDSVKFADEKLYLQLKTGLNIGFFRLSFYDIIETELGFQGALNSVFQGFGGSDNLGFDGVFFFGASMRLFQTVTLRMGYQHYSGHYGDETVLKINSMQTGEPIEYTRDNNLLFGLSFQPISQVRVYADANLPLTKSWMHPAIHIPSWIIKPSSGEFLLGVELGNEGITTAPDFPDSYKAWIINTGVELRYPLHNLGSLFLAAEVTANQDGQTFHTVGSYDPSNAWEFEYTVGAGLELDQDQGSSHARIMCTYHDGRFPLLNFFYQRTKYFSIGFSLSL